MKTNIFNCPKGKSKSHLANSLHTPLKTVNNWHLQRKWNPQVGKVQTEWKFSLFAYFHNKKSGKKAIWPKKTRVT